MAKSGLVTLVCVGEKWGKLHFFQLPLGVLRFLARMSWRRSNTRVTPRQSSSREWRLKLNCNHSTGTVSPRFMTGLHSLELLLFIGCSYPTLFNSIVVSWTVNYSSVTVSQRYLTRLHYLELLFFIGHSYYMLFDLIVLSWPVIIQWAQLPHVTWFYCTLLNFNYSWIQLSRVTWLYWT